MALWRGRVARGRAVLSVLALAALALAVLPLDEMALRPLEARYPVSQITGPVAGIVILGGGEDTRATAAWGAPMVNGAAERYLAALALARQFPDAPVLFTGGSGRLFPGEPREADIARAVLTGAGLAPERLFVEGASRNTAENARLGVAVAGERPGNWVLVTSAFHMPRAVETFCAAGWRGIVPYPTDFRSGKARLDWAPAGNLSTLDRALREWAGLAVYRATGRAAHPLPPGCLAGQ